ncbi:MAG: hypothetical protein M1831_004347 [Alyxoria varia]|nr:MAG: hypothetical protein M1831_004347 [Alyxoria varia]
MALTSLAPIRTWPAVISGRKATVVSPKVAFHFAPQTRQDDHSLQPKLVIAIYRISSKIPLHAATKRKDSCETLFNSWKETWAPGTEYTKALFYTCQHSSNMNLFQRTFCEEKPSSLQHTKILARLDILESLYSKGTMRPQVLLLQIGLDGSSTDHLGFEILSCRWPHLEFMITVALNALQAERYIKTFPGARLAYQSGLAWLHLNGTKLARLALVKKFIDEDHDVLDNDPEWCFRGAINAINYHKIHKSAIHVMETPSIDRKKVELGEYLAPPHSRSTMDLPHVTHEDEGT